MNRQTVGCISMAVAGAALVGAVSALFVSRFGPAAGFAAIGMSILWLIRKGVL